MSTNRQALFSFPLSLTGACALALALAGCGGDEQGNSVPTAAAASLVGDEDSDIVGRLSGADSDGDPLTFNVVRPPEHGSLSADVGGTFKYTPRANYRGRDSFEFAASDGQATSAAATVSIDVTAVNHAPSIEAPASLVVAEDSAATAAFTITDIDGEAAALIMKQQPAHGAVSLVGPGTLQYQPQPNFSGQDSFAISASDGQAEAAPIRIAVTVNPVNDAPSIAAPTSLVLDEDSAATASFTIADLDGEAAALIMRSPPAHGAVTLVGTNTLEYRPRPNFSGQDTFEISASDGQAEAAPIRITATVIPINDAPSIAAATALTLDEDSAATVAFTIADLDGEAAAFIMKQQPAHGAVRLVGPNTLEYRPQPNFNGEDSFEISASDGQAEAAPIRITATVNPVNDAPTIDAPTTLTLDEDSVATATFTIADIDQEAATFIMKQQPTHGAVRLVSANTLEYRPAADFNGEDTFEISASDGQAEATPIRITAKVTAVNDPPVLPAELTDMTNSAETLATRIRIPLQDVDGDTLTVTTLSTTPAVATASIDQQSQELVLTPVDYGQTQITVSAHDAQYSVDKTFTFSVEDVTKSRTFADPQSNGRAIEIENTSAAPIDFSLAHNDKRLLTSVFDVLDDVASQPDDVPAETFARKLWRYLRDNVYHNLPVSTQVFVHEPLLLVNSIGLGTCDDVATVYEHLAHAAGLNSRVWYLEGHVVPEVQIAGNWVVYDPDLAVYYTDQDAKLLGVMDLAADTSPLTSPTAPLFPNFRAYVGYSAYVADMYATTANNFLGDDLVPYLMVPQSPQSGLISVPAGAKLSYPGRWSAVPTGTDNIVHVDVPAYANMKLELPSGFTGAVRLPLQLFEIAGTGQIRLDGTTFTLGSTQLANYLTRPARATRTLEVIQSSSPIQLYMLINPLRFGRGPSDELHVTGKDVWALHVAESQTDPNVVRIQSLKDLRKPVP